jgi:hypothetical protein
LIVFLIFILFLRRKISLKQQFPSKNTLALLLVFVPVILHHAVFMEFTIAHDYSVIIEGIGWSLLFSILIKNNMGLVILRRPVIVIVVILSVAQYYFINRPGALNHNGDKYIIYKQIGNTIKETIRDDETVFIRGFSKSIPANNPQIMYYAKRNFVAIRNTADAYCFIETHERSKGRIYQINDDGVSHIEEISSKNH